MPAWTKKEEPCSHDSANAQTGDLEANVLAVGAHRMFTVYLQAHAYHEAMRDMRSECLVM